MFSLLSHRRLWPILVLCLDTLDLLLPSILKHFGFPISNFNIERTWWRLFQKPVVHSKFDIYVVIFILLCGITIHFLKTILLTFPLGKYSNDHVIDSIKYRFVFTINLNFIQWDLLYRLQIKVYIILNIYNWYCTYQEFLHLQ
jgi:hypothetical protein